jgi:hypothetical protein
MDERWLLRPPEVMAEETIASWMIRFQLVLEDLRAMQAVPPIVAEGAGLFPECVAPWLSRPHQALWLIPTRAFIAQVRHGRIHGAPYQTSDPARALANIIARDELIAQHHQRAAQERGLATYSIDGTRSLDDVTTSVAGYYTHFG